jgi:hypothetical protein
MAAQQVYALFQDVEDTQRAIGALLDHGVPRNAIGIASRRPAEIEEAGRVRTDFARTADREDQLLGQPVATYAAQPGTLPPAVAVSTVTPTSSVDTPLNVEEVGKSGITTTTPEDAGAGAAVGAGVGLIAGLGLAAAALIIPGVGPILAAGALASAFGLTVGTTVAGAAVGGAVGYLTDLGMGEQAASHYAHRLSEGDYLLTTTVDSSDYDEIKRLLLKYNAVGVDINMAAPATQVLETRGADPTLAAEMSQPTPPVMSAAEARHEGILPAERSAVPAVYTETTPGTHIVTENLDGTPLIPAREVVDTDTTTV